MRGKLCSLSLSLHLHSFSHGNNTGPDVGNTVYAHHAGATFPDPTKPSIWVIKALAVAQYFDPGGKQGSGNTFVLISFNLLSFELKGNSLPSLEFKNGMIFYA
jgi:hypothetical protein